MRDYNISEDANKTKKERRKHLRKIFNEAKKNDEELKSMTYQEWLIKKCNSGENLYSNMETTIDQPEAAKINVDSQPIIDRYTPQDENDNFPFKGIKLGAEDSGLIGIVVSYYIQGVFKVGNYIKVDSRSKLDGTYEIKKAVNDESGNLVLYVKHQVKNNKLPSDLEGSIKLTDKPKGLNEVKNKVNSFLPKSVDNVTMIIGAIIVVLLLVYFFKK